MFQINNTISTTECKGLSIVKLTQEEKCETLLVVLEKNKTFPTHTSPRNTLLVMLDGDIQFNINHKTFKLKKNQTFEFPAKMKHDVLANEDSKFLIIR